MRRNTPKTRKRYSDAQPARDAIRERITCCEWCSAPQFVLHEIPRAGVRSRVVGLASCILGLCDPGCHQSVAAWPKGRQAALLLYRRPGDFDLAELNYWLIARVSMEDVLAWRAEIADELARS